jgi:hypothetical protein
MKNIRCMESSDVKTKGDALKMAETCRVTVIITWKIVFDIVTCRGDL